MSDWNERVHNLDYDSAVALRYHGRRKSFLDRIARLDPALSVIFGATAFATVVAGYPKTAAWAALAVSVVSGLNLAFDLSNRARQHEALFQRWGALRAKRATMLDGDDQALRQLEAERAEIDASSPWQLIALSVLCENEEKKVRGAGAVYPIGRIQRILINIGTLPGWTPQDPSDCPHLPI